MFDAGCGADDFRDRNITVADILAHGVVPRERVSAAALKKIGFRAAELYG